MRDVDYFMLYTHTYQEGRSKLEGAGRDRIILFIVKIVVDFIITYKALTVKLNYGMICRKTKN